MVSQSLFRISGFLSEERQGSLFDEPLGTHGHIRTVIGNLMERVSARLLGARRHRTRNGFYCPDLSRPYKELGREYFEVKAAGRTRQTFIYTGRLAKDKAFVDAGRKLTYVVWHHEAETAKASTVRELEELVLGSIRSVFLVPFERVWDICQGLKIEPLNSAYGPARTGQGSSAEKTYGSGYRLNLSLLEEWVASRFCCYLL